MRTLAGCLAIPRVILILVWLFSDYLDAAYSGRLLWFVLGFLFMPMTTLGYGLVIYNHGSVESYWLIAVIAGALFDLGLLGKFKPSRKQED